MCVSVLLTQYDIPRNTSIMKLESRIRWAEHVTFLRGMTNAYSILVVKNERGKVTALYPVCSRFAVNVFPSKFIALPPIGVIKTRVTAQPYMKRS